LIAWIHEPLELREKSVAELRQLDVVGQ